MLVGQLLGENLGKQMAAGQFALWLLHVREAYDRHSYASIRKDAGVCHHHHHGSCEQFTTVLYYIHGS
jgi:hypothetical protein